MGIGKAFHAQRAQSVPATPNQRANLPRRGSPVADQDSYTPNFTVDEFWPDRAGLEGFYFNSPGDLFHRMDTFGAVAHLLHRPFETQKIGLHDWPVRRRFAPGKNFIKIRLYPVAYHHFSPLFNGSARYAATLIISLPKLSPEKSRNNVSGKAATPPSTTSSGQFSLPALSQAASSATIAGHWLRQLK